MLKKITLHYILAILLAVLLLVIVKGIEILAPKIGWTLLTFIYVLIGLFQIVFYYLTSYHKIGWSIASIIFNFMLWVFEQVQLDKFFHDTFVYQEQYLVVIIGAILWATNKLLIDGLLSLAHAKKHCNRIGV